MGLRDYIARRAARGRSGATYAFRSASTTATIAGTTALARAAATASLAAFAVLQAGRPATGRRRGDVKLQHVGEFCAQCFEFGALRRGHDSDEFICDGGEVGFVGEGGVSRAAFGAVLLGDLVKDPLGLGLGILELHVRVREMLGHCLVDSSREVRDGGISSKPFNLIKEECGIMRERLAVALPGDILLGEQLVPGVVPFYHIIEIPRHLVLRLEGVHKQRGGLEQRGLDVVP